MKRLLGLRALIHDAVDSILGLVEETHASAAHKPIRALGPLPLVADAARGVGALHGGIAKLAYGSARRINRGVESAGDFAIDLAQRAPVAQAITAQIALPIEAESAKELSRWADAAQSALNAWVGDHLARQGNNLSLPLGFVRDSEPLACTREAFAAALPNATPKVCVFVHGLGCSDATWRFRAREQFGDPDAHYGTFLARDLGYTPLYVRYNTGLHISHNARALAGLLEDLHAVYPCPIEEIALIGHSMGGLVSRGAAHYAQLAERAWLAQLSHVLCIGSPNLGAPLEKATNALASLLSRFDSAGTQVPAKLLNVRSSGIKDLRFGYVLDEDWTGRDPDAFLTDERKDVPMVPWVTYGFVAATFLRDPEHPLGALLGDLLVRVPSASGRAEEPARHVRFDLGEVVHGVHHIAMLNHPRVYAQLRRFLADRVRVTEGESCP